MVGLFLQHKEDPVLWSGHIGSTLLANFFSTLVSLVGNCGASPGTEILAKDLFELVWNFRDAEVSEIRLAVLDAVGTSFSLIREEALFAILMNESSFGVAAYLREASNSETDEQCRHAAQQVLGLVAATAKAIEY